MERENRKREGEPGIWEGGGRRKVERAWRGEVLERGRGMEWKKWEGEREGGIKEISD